MPAAGYINFLSLIFSILFRLSSSSSADNSSTLLFHEGLVPLYGEHNIIPYEGNKSVQISMDQTSSSGFRSKLMYVHAYFKASIKMPENYTAGVVVTFYLSNNQKYPYRHDEIDFEFLGHVHGQKWLVQTNFYGNGSTNRGREERYVLGFDPSEDFHDYGIYWSNNRITYYVDGVPIRHVKRVVDAMGMGDDFPSKEMRLYGTIWNGSNWATNGGRDKLDLTNYGPYTAYFSNFVINNDKKVQSCDGSGLDDANNNNLLEEERRNMKEFRKKYMTYSYCYDKNRYEVPLPECVFE